MNDRRVDADGQWCKFTSRILPPYMRRSPKVAEVLPVLYLRGLSTGDFREALGALLGKDATGLSATNIARLTGEWEAEYRAFQTRSLADREYVYVWVDGVHFNVRLEDDRLCTLVMIGVRPDGTKELITVKDSSPAPVDGRGALGLGTGRAADSPARRVTAAPAPARRRRARRCATRLRFPTARRAHR